MFSQGGGGQWGGGNSGLWNRSNQGGNDLPFAGVPSEMRAGVEKIVADEPVWGTPDVTFSQQPDGEPVTLRAMIRPHRRLLLACVALVIVETLTLQAGPYLMQVGIDTGIVDRHWRILVLVGVLSVVSVVATAVASGARIAATGRVAARVMNALRLRVFAHLQRLSLDYYTDEKAGVIITRMTSDIDALQQLLQDGLVQFAVQGLTMVLIAGILFSYDAKLAGFTLVLVIPVLAGLSLWFRAASDRGYGRVRDGIAAVLGDLSESLAGVRLVAGFNRQRHNVVAHRNVVGAYRDANDYTARINAVYQPSTDLIGISGQAVLLLVGGSMVRNGDLSLGELTAFLLYLNAFFQPIQQLVQQYNTYQSGQAAVFKLRQLLTTAPSVAEAPDAHELPQIQGEIVLEGVSFGYDPAVPVLKDVDLRIAPGETVSLVGPTGAGKSTVAKLVTRFYDPTAGRVLIDGHDLRDVTLSSLRRQLGVVPQEPFLFAGTMRDNIAFARPGASDAEVMDAVRRVGLGELVDRLPDGLRTLVHERGVSLASGERQLLALARAFLAQPRVLVLDEATSNLDLQSETAVEAALDAVLEGRTAIIVAHRLSTAMRADRIAVVDGGRVVEIGPHDELVAAGGRYAEMYAAWSAQLGTSH